jgi:hypothetical protein
MLSGRVSRTSATDHLPYDRKQLRRRIEELYRIARRSRGEATARIPSGAVASELAKEGKKKTIFLDIVALRMRD